jgi:hypothetical protein
VHLCTVRREKQLAYVNEELGPPTQSALTRPQAEQRNTLQSLPTCIRDLEFVRSYHSSVEKHICSSEILGAH